MLRDEPAASMGMADPFPLPRAAGEERNQLSRERRFGRKCCTKSSFSLHSCPWAVQGIVCCWKSSLVNCPSAAVIPD